MYPISHTIFFGIRYDDLKLERVYQIKSDYLPRSGELLEMGEGHGVTIDSVQWKNESIYNALVPTLHTYSGRDGTPPEYYKQFGYKVIE